jgi:hypothetical protein
MDLLRTLRRPKGKDFDMSDRLTSSKTEQAILFCCYAVIQSDDSVVFSERFFFERLNRRSSVSMIKIVLDHLLKQSYFTFDMDEEAYEPTQKLVEHVEVLLSMERISYQEKLSGILQARSDAVDAEESDTWSPIREDSDSVAKKDAIEAVQNVIERVTADNGFNASQPKARNSILYSLNAGLEMLKEHTPSRDQVAALLLKPLKYLGDLFAKHAIGELTKKAAEKILAWLSGF